MFLQGYALTQAFVVCVGLSMETPRKDPAVFVASQLPSDARFMAVLANGYLGTQVYGRSLHMGDVYNGNGTESHRAHIPSTLNVLLSNTGPGELLYGLNTRKGVFECVLKSERMLVVQRMYAHRSRRNLLVHSVHVQRTGPDQSPLHLNLSSSFTPFSEDIDFKEGSAFLEARYIYGEIHAPEGKECSKTTVHMVWTPVPTCLELPAGQIVKKWTFLTALSTDESEAKAEYRAGRLAAETRELYHTHKAAWSQLWAASCIDMTGDFYLTQVLYACMFYMLSALPSTSTLDHPFFGLSPGGLSNGERNEDYLGHVFWDQETWMYPVALLFHPRVARTMLEYRVARLGAARENSRAAGHRGAKFPWESAVAGHEVCPEDIYGQQEIHINGDVSFAFQQYFLVTQDLNFFSQLGGWDVVKSIAEYWTSRVEWNKTEKCYDINNVMPPDEYHNGVKNSVYTNVVAKYSLDFASDLGELLKVPVPPKWKDISSKLKIPIDHEKNYHPEYDGYNLGESVKQADVILLGFPLGFPMSAQMRKNDLEFYEEVTDHDGPAMTWSMFAVGWLEMNDSEKAKKMITRCYQNIHEPFKVWSENPDGSGAVNFLTGIGGFLQANLFGYFGIRITKEGLKFNPNIPENVSEGVVTGLTYLGNKIKFSATVANVVLTVTAIDEASHTELEVVVSSTEKVFPLLLKKPVAFPTSAGRIQMLH